MTHQVRYKILDKDLKSLYWGFGYEIGKTYHCQDFNMNDENGSNGFYAVHFSGILYSNLNNDNVLVECNVWGDYVESSKYKMRYEYIKPVKILNKEEIKELCEIESKKLTFNYYESINPINPLKIRRHTKSPNKRELEWFDQWVYLNILNKKTVWESVWDTIENSYYKQFWPFINSSIRQCVYNDVFEKLYDSIKSLNDNITYMDRDHDNVRDHLWNYTYAYVSSLFYKIDKWNNFHHTPDMNPFQCGINLWKSGLIVSFDGTTWRLHSGQKCDIVFEKTLDQF